MASHLRLLIRTFKILLTAAFMLFWGIVFSILKARGKEKNAALKQRARQLNVQAANKIGANSVFVKLQTGIQLHAVEAGDKRGKLVVLLHGFPDIWHSWSGVIPSLVKEGYFVVAPDMRGYNLSDKPKNLNDYKMTPLIDDIRALIEYYNKKDAVVIAHDWGGVVAWALAERHPDIVEKLIILNAPHAKAYHSVVRKHISQVLSSWYFLFFQIPFIPENLMAYDPFRAVKTIMVTKNKNALSEESRELLAAAYVQDDALTSMLNYYRAMIRSEIANMRNKQRRPSGGERQPVQVPTLILWGEKDTALIKELAMCSRWVKDVQVMYIPNCSHWVPYEVPDIVSREAIKFIA